MNNRRKLLGALGAGALVGPFGSFAQQQPAKVHRIGFLSSESSLSDRSRIDALQAGLRELGYVEGKNIAIEFRSADGNYDRLPNLAADLARVKPDVIVPFGIKAALAAKRATSTIPIIVPATADPVATGLVASLARPGGNVTGSSFFGPEMAAKQLELMKEVIPQLAQVAALLNPQNVSSQQSLRAMETAAKLLKVGLEPFEAQSVNELDSVFVAIAKKRIAAVIVLTDTLFVVNAKTVADLATRKRIRAAGNPNYADAGCLIGYGPNQVEMHRQAAVIVDKILKGAKPGDIPVEQATKFEMVVNMKTAKTLGIKIPPTIMVRATKVIE